MVRRLIALFAVSVLWVSAVYGQTKVSVQGLLIDPARYDQKVVDVQGSIAAINYVPDIRNGSSIYSFWLTDGKARVKVLNPVSGMLHKGDTVQVDGMFSHLRAGSSMKMVANELDATAGDVKVLKTSYVPPEVDRNSGAAVPTAPIDTPWSISVGIASIVSAIFAIVAASSLLLHARRFNLGLVITEQAPPTFSSLPDNRIEATLPLRLISTRGMIPQIRRGIEMRTGSYRGTPSEIRVGEEVSEVLFPLGIKDEILLTLKYRVPAELRREFAAGYRLIFRDAFSRKIFSARFKATV
jgi:hypothetical protein